MHENLCRCAVYEVLRKEHFVVEAYNGKWLVFSFAVVDSTHTFFDQCCTLASKFHSNRLGKFFPNRLWNQHDPTTYPMLKGPEPQSLLSKRLGNLTSWVAFKALKRSYDDNNNNNSNNNNNNNDNNDDNDNEPTCFCSTSPFYANEIECKLFKPM